MSFETDSKQTMSYSSIVPLAIVRVWRGARLFALLVEGIEYGSELLSFGRVWIDLL